MVSAKHPAGLMPDTMAQSDAMFAMFPKLQQAVFTTGLLAAQKLAP